MYKQYPSTSQNYVFSVTYHTQIRETSLFINFFYAIRRLA